MFLKEVKIPLFSNCLYNPQRAVTLKQNEHQTSTFFPMVQCALCNCICECDHRTTLKKESVNKYFKPQKREKKLATEDRDSDQDSLSGVLTGFLKGTTS
jgi:hypothetical protein